jgi:hypothetical protein
MVSRVGSIPGSGRCKKTLLQVVRTLEIVVEAVADLFLVVVTDGLEVKAKRGGYKNGRL